MRTRCSHCLLCYWEVFRCYYGERQQFVWTYRLLGMILRLLFLWAMFMLLTGLSCPSDCEGSFISGKMEVVLENPAARYTTGETIWVSADFSAIQGEGFSELEISENGGLFVAQLFQIQEDAMQLQAGLDDFTLVNDVGIPVQQTMEGDSAAVILQYSCPARRCAFRQGFTPNTAGLYLLRVNGSAIDVVTNAFNVCAQPTIVSTTLAGGGNLLQEPLNLPLVYERDAATFLPPIDTSSQDNVFLIRVE